MGIAARGPSTILSAALADGGWDAIIITITARWAAVLIITIIIWAMAGDGNALFRMN